MATKPLGLISDELHLEREEIRDLTSSLEKLKKAYKIREEKALERMEKEGTTKVTGELATMSVSVTTVPNAADWEKVYRYIAKNKAFHLLERRLAAKAWREEVESRRGQSIPGVEGFEKRTLLLRNL